MPPTAEELIVVLTEEFPTVTIPPEYVRLAMPLATLFAPKRIYVFVTGKTVVMKSL